MRFDVFTLDPARGVLLRDGSEVPLRRQSFDVLRYLAENAGRTVSSDELVQSVWVSRPADTAASVGQCIKELRRALGEDARWMVRTVSGRGYEFKAEIVWSMPSRPAATESPERARNIRLPVRGPGARAAATAFSLRALGWWLAAAGGAVCAVAAVMYLPGRVTDDPARLPPAAMLSDSLGGGAIGELFSPNDEQRVSALAVRKELPLPPFQMHAPSHEVPADVRRFVGVWASDTGWTGSNRQYMLIITDADRSGVVTGYHVNGPPQATSRFQTPAHYAAFKGSVSAASLSMEDGAGKFVATFLGSERIQLDLTFRDGLVARVVLDPVWVLILAEAASATPRAAAQAR